MAQNKQTFNLCATVVSILILLSKKTQHKIEGQLKHFNIKLYFSKYVFYVKAHFLLRTLWHITLIYIHTYTYIYDEALKCKWMYNGVYM